jgi:hypothetical protein
VDDESQTSQKLTLWQLSKAPQQQQELQRLQSQPQQNAQPQCNPQQKQKS